MATRKVTRRQILKAAAASAILAACGPDITPPAPTPSGAAMDTPTAAGQAQPTATMPAKPAATVKAQPTSASPAQAGAPGALARRKLGKTDWELSMVGFGGIVVKDVTEADAAAFIKQAIERGINYFDVAPSYGNAQDRLGPALEPYRKDVFLACKSTQRTRAGVEAEMQDSLDKLRTDYFDLYQFHAVTNMSDVEGIMSQGGALEAVLAAREAGKIRHIGFSAHNESAALAMLDRFTFDTILYPVNWVIWHAGNFGPKVVQKAEEQGLGILALKTLARQPWPAGADRSKWPKCWYEPVETPEDALLGMRFTLSKPVTAAVSPGHAELLWLMCDIAPQVTPLTAEEEAHIAEQSKQYLALFTS